MNTMCWEPKDEEPTPPKSQVSENERPGWVDPLYALILLTKFLFAIVIGCGFGAMFGPVGGISAGLLLIVKPHIGPIVVAFLMMIFAVGLPTLLFFVGTLAFGFLHAFIADTYL